MKRKREENEMETATQTSSSSDNRSGRAYQVFLSFRGPDTRLTITDYLYKKMIHKSIRAFKDNEELRHGEKIKGGLLRAINDSRIYIPIFSKNYASSKWCLKELAHIVDLSSNDNKKVILPIFYGVDADDVKLDTDLYKEAFENHERTYGKDVVNKWKKALQEVGGYRGRNLRDDGLHKLIDLTVKEVSNILWTRQTDVSDRLVGIKKRMDEIMKPLDLDTPDVRFIVIHGMGGIGKTTLAEAIFRKISPQFQGHCCFLRDVRTREIINLQKTLLDEVFNPSFRNISLPDDGTDMMKESVLGVKVLVVLDDVNNQDQIERLVGEPSWYGEGSRIIITTRNIDFLVKEDEYDNVPASDNGHMKFYPMRMMSHNDALQLFCERALGYAKPSSNYAGISEKLVTALGRLPLALHVVGSTLRGKGLKRWRNVLQKLKMVMNPKVKKTLMISYEELEPEQQQIYLDIACFFIGQEITPAIKYWDADFGYSTEMDVKILIRMSLIEITDHDTFWMHDQLRDLGRDISKRYRLWSPKEAFHVVQTKRGNKKIVALNLGTPQPDVTYRFKREEFVRLVNLSLLRLDYGIFEGDFNDLFSELRWLSWSNCPSEFSATNFGLKKLTVLMLSGNNITKKWKAWRQIMVATQLKVLQLKDCRSLKKTPEFSTISRLERLILRCTQLRKIDKSICKLEHLDYLEIQSEAIESLPKSIGGLKSLTKLRVECQKLSKLPHSIGNLGNLQHLILTCNNLGELPDSIGDLKSLLQLDANFSKISELPNSIGNLKRLKDLCIHDSYLKELPDSIGMLQSLVKLDLSSSRIKILPDSIGNLEKLKVLNLKLSHISEFPKTIGKLKNLQELDAAKSYLEGEIPSEIGALSSLKVLDLSWGHFSGLPTTINELTNLQRLELKCCHLIQQLPKLPKSLLSLKFFSDSLTTIPKFSKLTNLVDLEIIGGSVREEPKINGIVKLHALSNLTLSVGTLPPTDLSSLSKLQRLTISYTDSQSLTKLPSSLQVLTLEDVQSPINWSLFSNLVNLLSLHIEGYSPGEIQFEVLEKLPKFNALWLRDCPLLKTLPVLPCLKEIQHLSLHTLPKLSKIRGLGELKSLRILSIDFCDSIKSLNESDLSNLQHLKRLNLAECKSLKSVYVPESCELIPRNLPRLKRVSRGGPRGSVS